MLRIPLQGQDWNVSVTVFRGFCTGIWEGDQQTHRKVFLDWLKQYSLRWFASASTVDKKHCAFHHFPRS